jgi:hypothetical protein
MTWPDDDVGLNGASLRIRTPEHGKPQQVLKHIAYWAAPNCNGCQRGPFRRSPLEDQDIVGANMQTPCLGTSSVSAKM